MASVMFSVRIFLLFCFLVFHGIANGKIQLSTDGEDENLGTQWAVLLAGSSGYGNYRHQADVCHAYQILKRGGLKDDNIIVFMYDDIANNSENPRPGITINRPNGSDVYAGVPKDYTGAEVTIDNFFAVILGDKASVKGGSGKVVDSGPNDHIFIYYADHGGPGVLAMPDGSLIYANDFIDVLKKKHAVDSYKKMVIYVEACESGSIFEGLLPKGMNIYVTTAANATENSFATYCYSSPEYYVCLGDLYSVSWMEDSEVHNRKKETLEEQYQVVKEKTTNNQTYKYGSHVMQYGDIPIAKDSLSLYIGFDPANTHATFENSFPQYLREKDAETINQWDADLLYLWQKYKRSKPDSIEKLEAQQELIDSMTYRLHLDKSINLIGKLLFGSEMGTVVLKVVRPSGQPLVDDWDCLKTMVSTFQSHCGSLSQYGMKHMRVLANICNNRVSVDTMAEVSKKACT